MAASGTSQLDARLIVLLALGRGVVRLLVVFHLSNNRHPAGNGLLIESLINIEI